MNLTEGKVLSLYSQYPNSETYEDMKLFNILVVEDDEVDRMNIERAFKKANLTNPIFMAKDGIEALEMLKSGKLNNPLLILLDINMPRMNGLEFLKVLRDDPQWTLTPVVIMSSSREDKDRINAYSLSVTGYVIKPLEFGEFVNTMIILGQYWSLCYFPKE